MLKDFCKENPTRRYVQDQENKIQTANDWLNRMAPYEPSNDFLLHGIKSERAHPRCTACLSPVLYHAPLSPSPLPVWPHWPWPELCRGTGMEGRQAGGDLHQEYGSISLSFAPCVSLPQEPSRVMAAVWGQSLDFWLLRPCNWCPDLIISNIWLPVSSSS